MMLFAAIYYLVFSGWRSWSSTPPCGSPSSECRAGSARRNAQVRACRRTRRHSRAVAFGRLTGETPTVRLSSRGNSVWGDGDEHSPRGRREEAGDHGLYLRLVSGCSAVKWIELDTAVGSS